MKAARGMALALAAACVAATPAYAWDELGHRVVARIAWDHMTPAARQRAVELLLQAPEDSGIRALMPQDGRPLEERQRELFVLAAVWPDEIRSRSHPGNRYAHSDWHYVNFFWEQRANGQVVDRPDLPRAGFLIDQLQRIGGTLGDASRPAGERAVDLAWALHLVGDAHQPLHNSARITPQLPEGDRGGNEFRLQGIYPFNNLHAVWDGLTGPAFPWRVGEASDAEYVGRIARSIAADWPRARMAGRVLPGEFVAWSQEGLRVAQNEAYPPLSPGDRATLRYLRASWNAAAPRIALAGYRLAELLNGALAP
jgi:S1/P1 Nuclease